MFIDSTYKRDHTIFVCVWYFHLASYPIHVVTNERISFILQHSNILLYYVTHTHTHTHIYIFLHTHTHIFLWLHLQHMEVLRLGAESELQLPAYTTAIATWGLSRICNLHHSSWQCWIINPLSEARDWTHILMDTSQLPAEPQWKLPAYFFFKGVW